MNPKNLFPVTGIKASRSINYRVSIGKLIDSEDNLKRWTFLLGHNKVVLWVFLLESTINMQKNLISKHCFV